MGGVRGLGDLLSGLDIACMRLHHVCMHESCACACPPGASKWHFPRACTARPMHAGPAPAPGTSWRMHIWIICAIKHVHACMRTRASVSGPPQGCRAHASRGAQIVKIIFRALILIGISSLYIYLVACMRSCSDSAGLAKNIGQTGPVLHARMHSCTHVFGACNM